MNTALFDLAEYTSRSIFLTGKAGTGKTTFLNSFIEKTRKNYIVVAPTGIAAINAGGVTIHSMFGLPLRTFIPTLDRIDSNLGMNIPDLMPHFKYRKDKLKLLREVEIIIVDEVSMLRADVLDMIDFSLRHVRRNQLPFGGVQMLFVGDLYQLPPVVRDEKFLNQYYGSPFFFESYALKQLPLVTVELTTVYRQKDAHFLNILNAIRDGKPENIDFKTLNARYQPDFEPEDEPYVFLTSHNRMADDINQRKLQELSGKMYRYKAQIHGDFKENQYPNEEILELKTGAQVMFIRNDATAEKKYYNGKLAEVTSLTDEEIWVRIEGQDEEYKLKREIWEQKKYSLDGEKKIQEDVLGSFEQFPIRLAWAVTIHKSQGLTFDRLIIDAGKSFASGQVYVALSRCRTLEGIVLKSKINPEVIFSDQRVADFQQKTYGNNLVDEILRTEKLDYAVRKVLRHVDCRWIANPVSEWYEAAKTSRLIDKEKAKTLHMALKKECANLDTIYDKFSKILPQMVARHLQNDFEWKAVEEKARGAVNFFFKNVHQTIFSLLKDFYSETKGVKGLKIYNEELKALLDDLEDWLNDLKRVRLIETPLFNKENDVKVSASGPKVPTHVITYQLFEQGHTPQEIALKRGLVKETIFGHLGKYASQGILDITRLFPKEKIQQFEATFTENTTAVSLIDWKNVLPKEFEFHEIRLLLNHFTYKAGSSAAD